MDASQFDRFTASLPRRSVTGGLLALAFGVSAAEAKKKKPCPPCKKRKKGKCKGTLPDGTGCAGGTCQGGSCFVCPAQRVCGPGCCPEGQVCGSNGACVDPSCCSGDAICGPQTTAGRLCCIAPRVAFCCCDSSPGVGNGYAICCMGAECPTNCSTGLGEAGSSGPPDADGICGHGGNAVVDCPG